MDRGKEVMLYTHKQSNERKESNGKVSFWLCDGNILFSADIRGNAFSQIRETKNYRQFNKKKERKENGWQNKYSTLYLAKTFR